MNGLVDTHQRLWLAWLVGLTSCANELAGVMQAGLDIVLGRHRNVVREIGHVVGTGAKKVAQPISQDESEE